jgi:hypothetical protein
VRLKTTEVLTAPALVAAASGGAFLVAALYANYLAAHSGQYYLADLTEIRSAIPRTLGEVLELDLAQMPADGWRRPLLVALAEAKEPGFPPRLLASSAARLRPSAPEGRWEPPEEWRLTPTLNSVNFYLRRAVGPDGVTHYRLFHQSLVDHLRDYPFSAAGAGS